MNANQSKAPRFRPMLESMEDRITPSSTTHIAFGTDAGQTATVRVFNQDTGDLTASFEPFGAFTGGARVAIGDVDPSNAGDEVVVAAGVGGGPHVKVYSVTGVELGGAFVYDASLTVGVYVTTGDINADGTDEIITGPGAGGGPHVRSFDFDSGADGFSQVGGELGSFFAFDPTFLGGVRVGSGGSLAGSSGFNDEIVVGAGPGGGPHVRIYDGDNAAVLNDFFAFDATFTGGVYVSIGAIDGLGPQVNVGAGETGGPHLKVFDGGFGNGGMPTTFFDGLLNSPDRTIGVRPGTVVNLGIASDDGVADDPNNGYAFGAGGGNVARFIDTDGHPLNNINNFWFNPFPDLSDTGMFIS